MRNSILLFFVLFFVQKSLAQDVTPLTNSDEFLEKIKQTAASTHSIKAEFSEEKISSYFKEPQKSTGMFYYKKKNKLRWEKLKPVKYIFIANEDKVKIKENEKEKDVSGFNSQIMRIKEMMLTLVNGEFNSNRAYTPVYFYNNDIYLVKLVPKNKRLAAVFDCIQLIVNKENMRLKELSFFEKTGDKSVMKFFNDKINEDLSDNLFTDF